ncbi:MAG TPA: CpsD/CapB family tyrosine-protein kinase [Terracidiphilus sp.]|nr:CpsD/CapB family tyrosine-protein kinase [Terracidiphilus sp.]
MSQIFDALQRSEAERSGKGVQGASKATELLQRTEDREGSKPASEETRENRDAMQSARRYWEEGFRLGPKASVLDGAVATTVLTQEEAPVQADSFQSVRISPPANSKLVCLPDNDSAAAEAFHLLGVRLRHMRRERALKKLLITSTIPQEGKSVVAANVACTLAMKTRQKVLLVEGDVRRPSQGHVFGISNRPGICEWLSGKQSLKSTILQLEGLGMWMLPAGSASNDSLELLKSGKLSAMMDELSVWFDWIVIDSPPVLPLADTSIWTSLADGILLVTRQGTTEKRQLRKGLEALEPQKLIGALLNSSTTAAHSDYYYRPSTPVQGSSNS